MSVWTWESKKLIVEKLEEFGVPFTDVGMGVQLAEDALGGMCASRPAQRTMRDHFRSRVSFGDAPGGNEYNRNIQIADLNALKLRWR